MNEPSPIERIVMRRVRTISILRPIFSGGVLAALVLTAALWGIGREVWVARVFANGPQDFLGHAQYLFYAFEHTRLIVQALVLLTVGSVIYLARVSAHVLADAVMPRAA